MTAGQPSKTEPSWHLETPESGNPATAHLERLSWFQRTFPFVEEKKPSYTVGGNVSWCSQYEKHYGGSSKTKNRADSDPAIPLPGIYLNKTIILKDACTPMFTAVPSTQPRHRNNLKVY